MGGKSVFFLQLAKKQNQISFICQLIKVSINNKTIQKPFLSITNNQQTFPILMRRQQSVLSPFQSELFKSQSPHVQFLVNESSLRQSTKLLTRTQRNELDRSLLMKSHNVSQKCKYLKYDFQGNTQLVDEIKQLEEGFSYQKVHLEENEGVVLGEEINWVKELQRLNSSIISKEKIVFRPLRKLWQRNYRPGFFDSIQKTKGIGFKHHTCLLPQCLYQLDHLSCSHTKFLFLTQNYSQTGLYRIAVNEDGRFRVVTVNELVPVYEQSNQHIWGIEQPWKMILLKVWACLNQGYCNILKSHRPFRFLQYFTGNNWKYYNLQRERLGWVDKFKDFLGVCYIVLQTKNSQEITKMGLVPDSVAYNIVNVRNDSQRGTEIEVKSRFKHQWKGKLNVVNYTKKFVKGEGKEFAMEKNFLLTQQEFLEVFCCAYVTSLSKSGSHVSDYVRIEIPKNTKKAVYLKFSIKKQGFLDFSFIQSHMNKIPLQSASSKIDSKDHKQNGRKSLTPKSRFLKCKYMVIRNLKGSTKPFESKLSKLINRKQPQLTKTARYQAYEVQYLRGYNKGEAHFLMMEPGEYYFRLKSQPTNKDAVYYLNYCCSQKLDISEEIILGQERDEILENCMLSLLPASSYVMYKQSVVYHGNRFDEMGYGFVVVENVTKRDRQARNVYFEIDLRELQLQGYKLKGERYKGKKKSRVVLEIKPEEYFVVILKRISDDPTITYYSWPPKSMGICKAPKPDQE